MSTLALISQIALALVFVVWTFEMFRMLFRISRRANDRRDETGGGHFAWAAHSLSGYRWFFSAAETRTHRNRVVLLTAVLMALVVTRSLLLIPAA